MGSLLAGANYKGGRLELELLIIKSRARIGRRQLWRICCHSQKNQPKHIDILAFASIPNHNQRYVTAYFYFLFYFLVHFVCENGNSDVSEGTVEKDPRLYGIWWQINQSWRQRISSQKVVQTTDEHTEPQRRQRSALNPMPWPSPISLQYLLHRSRSLDSDIQDICRQWCRMLRSSFTQEISIRAVCLLKSGQPEAQTTSYWLAKHHSIS
ncbi:hypothetical protein LZ32DRAFT_341311 [Colletotrichum eremochloae]|nr:hypothetical protein LZ32DRAFT_341311 [Colletotrichum eremochloae]